MESTPNAYPYVALDSRSREIRLLELSPGAFLSDIECHLIHVSLHDSPQYEALSYCWGNPAVTRPISLDGHRFLATESAESALRYLRYQDTARVLWIDALCINQADAQERSQQVRIMADIYSGARKVIAWLGEEEKEGVPARSGAEGVRDGLYPSVTCAEQCQSGSKSGPPVETANECCLIDGVDIIPLYRRPWWRRIWVIQEVAVATSTAVTVQYGQYTHDWQNLRGAWGSYFFQGGLNNHDLTQPYEIISTFKRRIWFGGRALLTELLEQFRCWKATDPRDKIYALLGLSSGSGKDFEIDYTKPVRRVYIDLVIHLISHEKNLDILSHSSVSRTLEGLPSWAPDWLYDKEDELPPGRQPLQWKHDKCQNWYAASAGLEAQASFQEPDTLVICGFVFDAVELVGNELQADDASCLGFTMNYPQSTVMDEWEAMALDIAEGNDPYFGQDGRFEAFCRTLIADVDSSGARAEAQMFDHFLSWCERPRVPPKASIALRVARSLGYIPAEDVQKQKPCPAYGKTDDPDAEPLKDIPLDEREGNEKIQTDSYELSQGIAIRINQEFEEVYKLKKESLSKLGPFDLSKEEMFRLLDDAFKSDRASQPFCSRMSAVSVGRKFVISHHGYMGIVPSSTERGDLICILFGGRVPFILRAAGGGRYRLIGECYVHGIMDGEALDDSIEIPPSKRLKTVQEFMLI